MSEKLEFDLVVPKNDLKKSLDEGIKKSSILEDSLSTALGVFGGSLITKGFDTIVDGIGSIINIGKSAISAASSQEVAINNLNNALARSGNLTKEAAKSLQEYAGALQATSVYEDDVVLSNLALLQSLTRLNTEGLKGGVTAAADFATVLGIDLETATRLVAKAANGNTEAFKRYGVEIKKGATDTESFTNTINALNAQFGGSSAAQLNTFNGALKATKNAYADLLEPIGDIVVKNPIVVASFVEFKNILNDANKSISENNGALKLLVEDGFFAVISAAQVFFDSLDGITVVLKALGNTALIVGNALISSLIEPFSQIIDSAIALGSIIPGIGDEIAKLQNPLANVSNSIKSDLNEAIEGLKNSADSNIFRALSDGAGSFADKVIETSSQITIANNGLKNSNASRVGNESEVNEEILKRRQQLGLDLQVLNAQFAATEQTFKDQMLLAEMDEAATLNEVKTLAVYDQKLREAEAAYQGELIKNSMIQDAQEQKLANDLAFEKRQQTAIKASNDKQLADTKAAKQGQLALEQATANARGTIIGQSFQLAATLAKDGSKAQFLIQKAAALAEIAIGDGKARALIPAQTALIPYPANLAAAAQMNALVSAQTALGASIVTASAIKGFAGGGIVGGEFNGASGGGDDTVITARKDEMMLNGPQQKFLFDAIKNNTLGGGDIVIKIDEREIFRAVRNQLNSGARLA